jgi:hypothetical protein
MRSTEWLPASRLVLGLVPRPARVAPRVAIGDRGRWAKNKSFAGADPDHDAPLHTEEFPD